MLTARGGVVLRCLVLTGPLLCAHAAGAGPGAAFVNGGELGTANTRGIAVLDLNGDGHVDVFAAVTGGPDLVFVNNQIGDGSFFDTGQRLGTQDATGAAAGDFDGDGDSDILVVTGAATDAVWLNDGDARFTLGAFTSSAGSRAAAVGDVNHDGKLDAVVLRAGQRPRVYIGRGNGSFTERPFDDPAIDGDAVALADLDDDEDLDAFVVGANQVGRIWLNDGDGNFRDSGQQLPAADSRDVALHDVNGDGDVDAVVANHDGSRVWLNDGDGEFSMGAALGLADSNAVALGDVNGDGRIDAVLANTGEPNRVWLGTGSGSFTRDVQVGTQPGQDVALADGDGDADVDIFTASNGTANIFWKNWYGAEAENDRYFTGKNRVLATCKPGGFLPCIRNKYPLHNDRLERDATPTVRQETGVFSGPFFGIVALAPDGTFLYQPQPDYEGPDTFEYSIDDGVKRSNTATVTIVVLNKSRFLPPVALGNSYTVDEDGILNVSAPGILSNDVGTGQLVPSLVSSTNSGMLDLHADGSFLYLPESNFSGTDTFVYAVSDGVKESGEATVTITVTARNAAPMASADGPYILASSRGESLTISAALGVLANDVDQDGTALTAMLDSAPANGSLTLRDDGGFTYTRATGFTGDVTFTYHASDGEASSPVVTATIRVRADNAPPVGVPDSFGMDEDRTLTGGVLANDTDADGDSLRARLVTGPAMGTLLFGETGLFTYVPAPDAAGMEAFTYVVTDGLDTSAPVQVSITVRGRLDILHVTPRANAVGVEPSAAIELVMDAPAALMSVNAGVVLHGSFSGRVAVTPSVNGNTLRVRPTVPLSPGEQVQVSISTALMDTSGQSLPRSTVFEYRVQVPAGSPVFTRGSSGPVVPGMTWAGGTLGDVDEDGDLDAVLYARDGANPQGGARILRNNGAGVMTDLGLLPGSSEQVLPRFYDVDNDGDLDLVAANDGIQINDGMGGFTAGAQISLGTGDLGDISTAMADLDGDGDQDAVMQLIDSASQFHFTVLLNDGAGTFTDTNAELQTGGWPDFQVSIADLDDDGDLDIVASQSGGNMFSYFINDGHAAFTEQPSGIYGSSPQFGDLDGDGDVDLFVTDMADGSGNNGDQVFMNDGLGRFTRSGPTLVSDASNALTLLADLNGDGALDALVGNSNTYPSRIRLNDGRGGMASVTTPFGMLDLRTRPALGDLDGDGDLDMLAVHPFNGGGSTTDNAFWRIWFNRQPPVARPDTWSTPEDTVLNVPAPGLLTNDGPGEGTQRNAIQDTGLALGPRSGTVMVNANGSFTYTPEPNFFGFDFFTYHVTDETADPVTGTSRPAVALVEVTPVNDLPVVAVEMFEMVQGGVLRRAAPGLLANDSDDADEDALTASPGTAPIHGTFSVAADGAFTYTPLPEYFGPDAFTYRVLDGTAESPGNVAITVLHRLEALELAPARGASRVAVRPVISARFNADIDGITAAGSFFVVGSRSGPHRPTITTNGATVTLTPVRDFVRGETVTVTITLGLRGTERDTPLIPLSWRFDVGSGAGPATFVRTVQDIGASLTRGVAMADLNGDGNVDAFFANLRGGNTVWLNDTSGALRNSGQVLGDSDSVAVGLADLDGDTDIDAWVVNATEPAQVWVNDGTGDFLESTELLGTGASDVALADLNGDGSVDAVMVSDAGVQVWMNGGSGTFTDNGAPSGAAALSVAVADLDGDGDLDAWVGGGSGSTVWRNGGAGVLAGTGVVLGTARAASVAVGDLDGDGDRDAFVGNANGQPNRVYVNNGQATFTDSNQTLGDEDTRGTALADVDEDGDLDAITSDGRIWLNGGIADFTSGPESVVAFGQAATDLATADLDGVNGPDVLLVYSGAAGRVWLSEGMGSFEPAERTLGNTANNGVALADLDGDGDLDAFIASDGYSQVWLGGGDGMFADSGQTLGQGERALGVALGDVDGDDDVDAFLTGSGLWRNDGSGFFTQDPLAFTAAEDVATALADLDGDGDLDAFVARRGPAKVFFNDGAGTYAEGPQPIGSSSSTAVALGDLDGDGDVDAFVVNQTGQSSRVWLNNASGVFMDSGQTPPGGDSVRLVDMDLDGDLDAVLGGGDPALAVVVNDGQARFTPLAQSLPAEITRDAAVADVDGDGDQDVLRINTLGPDGVILNAGDGVLSASAQRLGEGDGVAADVGDLDGDGDADAFVVNRNQPAQVWLNAPIPGSAPDAYTVLRGEILNVTAPGVLANDTAAGTGPLSARIVTGTQYGMLTLSADGSFRYVQQAQSNFPTDRFTYVAVEGVAQSVPVEVEISINTPQVMFGVNADAYETNEGQALVVAAPGLLANDVGTGLVASLALGAANGAVAVNADGSFTYTPGNGFSGVDRFDYRATDGVRTLQATVAITVRAEDRLPGAPVALSPRDGAAVDAASVSLTLVNAQDPEDGALTYTFEIYGDETLATRLFQQAGVPAGALGTTSLDVTTLAAAGDTALVWRAFATQADGRSGPPSEPALFNLAAPPVTPPPPSPPPTCGCNHAQARGDGVCWMALFGVGLLLAARHRPSKRRKRASRG